MENIHLHTIISASVQEGAKITVCEDHVVGGFCDCASESETPGSIRIAARISEWLRTLPLTIIDVA